MNIITRTMKYENVIFELLSKRNNNILSVEIVKFWLNKYWNLFVDTVDDNFCSGRKLPCFCHIRRDECLFIDIYKKLELVNELDKLNFTLKKELEIFEQIKENFTEVEKWLLKNSKNGINKTGRFSVNPKYTNYKMSIINGKPYNEFDYIQIEIDGNEFKFIYDFSEIFTEFFFNKKLLPSELEKWRYENNIPTELS